MTKPSSKFPDPDPSGKSLETLATVTERIVQNRGDSVAIVAIVGLVLAFITTTIISGLVFASVNNPNPRSPNPPNATRGK